MFRELYKKPKTEEAPIVIKHKVSVVESQVEAIDITVLQKEEPIKREDYTIVEQEIPV